MKRRGNAWPAVLIALSAIGSAVLATWLAGNLVERELRQSSLTLNQARSALLASMLDANLARTADAMAAGSATTGDTGAGKPDLLLVDAETLRVLESDSPEHPVGQLLTSDAGRRAVQHATQSRTALANAAPVRDARWQVDLNTRPVSAWLALPASSLRSREESASLESGALPGANPAAPLRTDDVRRIMLARVIPARLIQPGVFPDFSPAGMQWLTQADVTAASTQAGALVHLLEPSVRLAWQGTTRQPLGVTAPVVGRALLGASLVALLLSAAWWRFCRTSVTDGVGEPMVGGTAPETVGNLLPDRAADLEQKAAIAEQSSAALPATLQRLGHDVITVNDVVSLLAEELERLGESSEQASRVIEQSEEVSGLAATHAGQLSLALHETRNELRASEKRVKAVAERAQEIGGLVSTITDLAERTGILALNASLQAAAAGPAGRQFASIAQEVKRLADSAAQTAVQLGGHVGTIREETRLAADAASAASVAVAGLAGPVRDSQQGIDAVQINVNEMAGQLAPLAALAERNAEYQARINDLVRSLETLQPEMQRVLDANLQATRELTIAVREITAQVDGNPVDGDIQ